MPSGQISMGFPTWIQSGFPCFNLSASPEGRSAMAKPKSSAASIAMVPAYGNQGQIGGFRHIGNGRVGFEPADIIRFRIDGVETSAISITEHGLDAVIGPRPCVSGCADHHNGFRIKELLHVLSVMLLSVPGYGNTALTGDACLAKSAPCIQPDVSGSMGALHPGLLFLEQDLKTFKLVVTFFTERIAGAAPDASPTLSRGIEKTICQVMLVRSG